MKWIKKGLIFVPDGKVEWMSSYASVPVVDHIHGDLYRIYFSSRNSKNRSSIGFIEIDINEPTKILHISNEPVLTPGKIGTFDDTGVWAASIVNFNKKKFLYYIGWNQPKTVPFRWSIGLAISSDNGQTFTRFSEGPIMDRNPIDPYFVSSPTVIHDENIWRMYYVSGKGWETYNDELRIPYNIRYAESQDGINWERKGIVCIDFSKEEEIRVARATIFKENEIYKMLFSCAIENYRIGYAESQDGITWERKDELAGIDVSASGWDSEMIEYPYLFEHKGKKFLLYNGNNYGKTGFGYATE